MSSLIEDPDRGNNDTGNNAPEFTVTQISGAIKRTIEGEFGHVRVRGEIGRVSRPRSGHIYLDLKDDRSVLSGVIWKGVAQRMTTRPEEGLEVIATGKLTTFGGQSKYQIVIESITPAGAGALMAMLERRKAQLQAEGLFAPDRKRQLPYLPEVIGVITSPSGAVIRDILHRLRDRFARRVLIWPVAVQGQRCAPDVARAIAGFNALAPGGTIPRPDLLIVARGGGSLEDLWGFNEEIVARAVANSEIPLISAVGHETDTTLIDYVSDRRAPTPTAAAEIAVPVRLELLATVVANGGRLSRAVAQAVGLRAQRLRDLGRALPSAPSLLQGPRQRLDQWGEKLPGALNAAVQRKRLNLGHIAAPLQPSQLRQHLRHAEQSLIRETGRLHPALERILTRRTEQLARAAPRLNGTRLLHDMARKRHDLDGVSTRLCDAARNQLLRDQNRLGALERLRQTLGYTATLDRGYAVVRAEGAVIARKTQAKDARSIEIEFADGRLTLLGASARKGKTGHTTPGQGSLF